MDHVEVLIESDDAELLEILIAELSGLEFSGFEESDNALKAYITTEFYNELKIIDLENRYKVKISTRIVPQQNWNALWESNFQPVIVGNFCSIRADFHPPFEATKHEVLITPKMSFGTGHHATTYMMVDQMQDITFTNKTVADFGTGTGILAILAEKLGSTKIVAIDYDEWSINNAEENLLRNNSQHIILSQADSFPTDQKFDIILANINKNVILQNINGLVFGTNSGGFLLISGILKQDEEDIVNAFAEHNFSSIKTVEKNNWLCILFKSSVEKGTVN